MLTMSPGGANRSSLAIGKYVFEGSISGDWHKKRSGDTLPIDFGTDSRLGQRVSLSYEGGGKDGEDFSRLLFPDRKYRKDGKRDCQRD
jgi:hypothetical protein